MCVRERERERERDRETEAERQRREEGGREGERGGGTSNNVILVNIIREFTPLNTPVHV